jgi:nuclease S1
MRKPLLVVLATVLLSTLCWGWGREGHQIVATVAEDHLDETTKVMIQSLIGNNHLYSVASWADDVRRERRETGPWHYVNIPLGSKYDSSRDCALPHSCVVAKIDDFVKVLTDKKAPREERAEALKFLVHFVGDIHQPMHAAKEAAGGNGVHVSFLSSNHCGPYECNLHAVWDTSIILRAGMKRGEYAQHEEELIRAERLDEQAGGTPQQWANESLRLAQAAWVHDGTNLDEGYYQREIQVVDRQMALAGMRLAKLLNESIGKMTPKDFR